MKNSLAIFQNYKIRRIYDGKQVDFLKKTIDDTEEF